MKKAHQEIKIGDYFETSTRQLRKVVGTKIDKHGRLRVIYLVKSLDKKGKPFGFQGTKANPPLLETFVGKCHRKLSTREVNLLRNTNILLEGE